MQANAETAEAKALLERVQAELEQAMQDAASMETAIVDVRAQVRRMEVEREEEKQRITSLEEQLQSAKDAHENALAEKTLAELAAAARDEQRQAEQAVELAQKNVELETLREALSDCEENELELQRAHALTKNLRGALLDSKKRLARLREQLERLRRDPQSTEEARQQLQEIQGFQNAIYQLEEDLEASQSTNAELREQLERLRRDPQSTEEARRQLQEIQGFQNAIAMAEEELSICRSAYAQLRRELQAAREMT